MHRPRPNFVDPDPIRDAPLEPSGLAGARALREPLARDAADVELIVSSPLDASARDGGVAAFDDALTRGVPALALHAGRGALLRRADVGTPVSKLRDGVGKRFTFRREEFPADNWWYGARADSDDYAPPPADDWRPPGAYCSAGEPLSTFRARMAALTEWLAGAGRGRDRGDVPLGRPRRADRYKLREQ